MTGRPLIGLSGRRWPVERVPLLPLALEGEEVDLHLSEYPKGIAAVGGLPVQLTRDADPVDMISRLDGLVMTGGADPDPSLYGEVPHSELGEIEPARDAWELGLIRAALDRQLPMLCVCRGAQLLNIALGGTLVQHLDEADTHALWTTSRTDRCHVVQVSAGSRLASLYGPSFSTNSLHHQAVGRPGDGVIVTGTAEDGVIEGFEVDGRPEVLAVQWHPEMLAEQPDPAFEWLVGQATDFAARSPTN
ncbi:MAG: gamma-glutamyl-gamma-aminobutyrate hydrolase family protein [Ilumatobacteraceae bacterium]